MCSSLTSTVRILPRRLFTGRCFDHFGALTSIQVVSHRGVSNNRRKYRQSVGRRDPKPATQGTVMADQKYEYLLVLDFEATCEQNAKIQPIQEIIEFPVVQLCTRTMQEVARFHEYVRPTERPIITSFCSHLTGIVQEMIDGQSALPDVLKKFDRWLGERHLIDSGISGDVPHSWTFVTCGDWDLGTMLPDEAAYRNLQLPSYFDEWVNVKKAYCNCKGYFPNSLLRMLDDMHIAHTGHLHSGIDDVLNICAIVKKLAEEGCLFQNTSRVNENPKAHGFGKWWRTRLGDAPSSYLK